MSQGQRLFNTGKVGLFCDSYKPGVEKRRGEEVKVLQLTLRLQPFDAKLAHSIDDGVGEDSNVRTTLFKMGEGAEARPHLDRVDFALGCQRQRMEIFASPDTDESRLLFDQVRISGTYARTEKGINDYAFIFRATFGPLARDELEYIHAWHLSQRFVTFSQAEPLMEFEEDEDDDGADPGPVVDGRVPAPMWDDDAQPASTDKSVALAFPKKAKAKKRTKPAMDRSHRKLLSHQSKKGSKRR